MVLESLLSPENAERNPWELLFLSFVFVTIAVWATDFLGIQGGSLLLVALVAVPAVPVVLRLFDYEEKEVEDKTRVLGSRTVARHLPVIVTLAFFFLGMILAFTFWYLAMPPEKAATLFSVQIEELKNIGGAFSGYAVFASKATFETAFQTVFMHNLGVLGLILGFSVLYGAGAILILIWNASVISVFVGNFAKQFVFHAAPEYSVLAGVSAGILGLMPHGTFELIAYLVTALAGGILSSAIIRKAYSHNKFGIVVYDIVKLVAFAILLLAIGAGIEAMNIAGI